MFIRLIMMALLLPAIAHAQGSNLLIIGWDGSDHKAIEHMLALGKLPTLATVQARGGYWELTVDRRCFVNCTEDDPFAATSTKPGWTEIHTGVDPVYYGVYENRASAWIPDGDTILERLAAFDPSIILGWLTGKAGNTDLYCDCPSCGGAPFHNLCDNVDPINHYPQDRKTQNHPPNPVLTDLAIDFVTRNAGDRWALSLIYAFPDHAGHLCPDYEWGNSGWNHGYIRSMIASPGDGGITGCTDRQTGDRVEWGAGTDYETGRLLAALEQLGLDDKTIVVITSDHGFPNLPFPTDVAYRSHRTHPDSWAASNVDLGLTMPEASIRNITPVLMGLLLNE